MSTVGRTSLPRRVAVLREEVRRRKRLALITHRGYGRDEREKKVSSDESLDLSD